MGNIEYPLQVPANADLGDLEHLLTCGLAIEFGIGELDIQASREGLSYIPETIAAIKAKLEALNEVLADRIAEEIAAIKNPWEKAYRLRTRMNTSLWNAAVQKYLADTGFDLINANRYGDGKTFYFSEDTLAKKFNIKITAFKMRGSYYGDRVASTLLMQNVYDNTKGYRDSTPHWSIQVADTTQFVINDTTVGAGNRAKYHWKTVKGMGGNDYVYVLEKADKKKDMRTKAFFNALSTPPATQIRKASTLMQKERAAGMGKDVSILHLEKRDNKGYMRSNDMVWRDAGSLAAFDDSKTYYYLPMSGFQAQGVAKDYDMKSFAKALRDSGILTETVYGVRKADLESVQGKSNWVNLDEYVSAKLAQQGALDVKGIVKEAIGHTEYFKFPYVQNEITNTNSPYLKMYNEFATVNAVNKSARQGFQTLCTIYNVTAGNVNVTDEIAKYNTEMQNVRSRYPLINELTRYFRDYKSIAEYINAIDMLKGI